MGSIPNWKKKNLQEKKKVCVGGEVLLKSPNKL